MKPADLSKIQEGVEKILEDMKPYEPVTDTGYGEVIGMGYTLGFKSAIVEVQKLLLKE